MRKHSAPPKSPAGPWTVVFTRQAAKDANKVARHGLRAKVEWLLTGLAEDPLLSPPPWERVVGDLSGAFSRRINFHHRLVCEVLTEVRTGRVLRMWTLYE